MTVTVKKEAILAC